MLSATALLACLLPALPAASPDTVVVCPTSFRSALDPWLKHRAEQGHAIALLPASLERNELRTQIRRIGAGGSLQNVVLIGDADPAMQRDAQVRAVSLPTQHVEAKVNVHWGSEPEIASDNWYADLDDDRLPDVAMGRLTADSPSELSRIVQKILDYERCADFGLWRRRVNLVAGIGGFGPVADFVLEASTKRLLTDGIPPGFQTTMTQASWRSAYCPEPRLFQQTTLSRLSEGCLFWVYIGHGHIRTLDALRVPGGAYPILRDRDVPSLRCTTGSPIACFLACYTAAFDQSQDCLAEEMLRSPGSPVAIIGGSRVTMPYAMACLGTELLDECFVRRTDTLGAALLNAKRRMMETGSEKPNRAVLDALAKALSPVPADLEAERAEHLDLFTLIGDPLLRLQHSQEVQLELTSESDRKITAKIMSPVSGRCTLELITPRDRLRFVPTSRSSFNVTPQAAAEYAETYAAANDDRWTTVELSVTAGKPAQASIIVPTEARGRAFVRAFVQSSSAHAVGAVETELQKRPAP
jgi:hypothetical protein